MDEVACEWNPEGCLGFHMRKGFPGRGLSMSKERCDLEIENLAQSLHIQMPQGPH